MLINDSHRSWAWATFFATLFSIALYILCFHPEMVPFKYRLPSWFAITPRPLHYSVGNSPLGLTYGIFSFAIFLFAVLLSVRRKYPLLPIGRVQYWLRAHIWLTILTIPLVLMHAAFRFGGIQSTVLMWLYIAVMLSGFYGLALQNLVPRIMRERLPLETIFEQIPYLKQQLMNSAIKVRDDAKALLAIPVAAEGPGAGEPDPSTATLVDALDRDILPYLALANVEKDRLSQPRAAEEYFNVLRLRVKPDLHDRINLLESWCDERRQMDVQARYQHWLHGWILFHAPVSFLLVIATAWHAVAVLFFY
jgi:hypothetical protein